MMHFHYTISLFKNKTFSYFSASIIPIFINSSYLFWLIIANKASSSGV